MTDRYGPTLNQSPEGASPAASYGAVRRAQPFPYGMKPGGNDPQEPKKGGLAARVIFICAIVLFVCSMGALGWLVYTYWDGQHTYDELADEYFEVTDDAAPTTAADFNIDWDALRAINPDVVGWVYVPGTVINYPICWREGDSTYYLKHNFGKNSVGGFGAEYGAIFLDGVNSGDWTDQVNVLYGHHMANGSMFALLADFAWNSELFNQHRTFYVLTPEGNFKTTSFAVNKVLGSSTDIVIPSFETAQGMQDYVQARLDANLVTPENPPAPEASEVKQVFAFSTCSEPDNSYRIITFCSVDEFVPAGSTVARSTSLVQDQDVSAVEGAVSERLL